MLASAIRELAVSANLGIVAAAYFERNIEIWNVASGTRVNELSTSFCAGANCLALATDAKTLVTGRSTVHGDISAYDTHSGLRLWSQRLIYPRRLRLSQSGRDILCTNNNRSIIRFDLLTGSTLETMDGVEQYIESPYGAVLIAPAKGQGTAFRIVSNDQIFSINRLSFALSDASFSPWSVCIAEARGAVRCLSCCDGRLEWIFDPGVTSQVLSLHYSSGTNTFWGILKDLNMERFASRRLVKFDSSTGKCEHVCELNSWAETFLSTTDLLVTSAGEVLALSNGVRVGRLAFPQKDYPDK